MTCKSPTLPANRKNLRCGNWAVCTGGYAVRALTAKCSDNADYNVRYIVRDFIRPKLSGRHNIRCTILLGDVYQALNPSGDGDTGQWREQDQVGARVIMQAESKRAARPVAAIDEADVRADSSSGHIPKSSTLSLQGIMISSL